MSKYTVKQVKPTGKEDATYGTEYHVQFNEDDRVVTVSRKTEVTVGQEFNGEIKDGKFGAYFKKDPFVPASSAASTSKPSFTPRKDNSEGMKMGMCINNAANFVNAIATPEMTDTDWANMIHAYASALYTLGDLVATPAEEPLVDPFADPTTTNPFASK